MNMVLRILIIYYLKNMFGPLIVNLLGNGARTNEVYKNIQRNTGEFDQIFQG